MRCWFVSSLLVCGMAVFAQERGVPLPRKSVFGAQLAPVEKGLELKSIIPAQTAEAAGLKAGDVLVSVDGTVTKTVAELLSALKKHGAGDKVTFAYLREGKPEKKSVALVARPKQQSTDKTEVIYDQIVSKGKRIRLILTHPKTPGKHPLVMLVGGIGAYSVDGDFNRFPYGNILQSLSDEGYATARIDKPGQGDSEGPDYPDLGFNTELDAYREAVKMVKSFDFVESSKIVIYGHSMGTAFGPLIASETKLAGVIAASGFVKSWPEYMLENTRRQMILGGTPESAISDFLRKLDAVDHYFFYEGKTVAQVVKDHPELAQTARDLCPDGKTYSGVGLTFFKELADKDLAGAWAKVDAKVLCLCGENDFVASEGDHPIITRIVNQAHPGNAEYIKVPQSDHGYSLTTSWQDAADRSKPHPFNPALLTILKDWLKKTIG